MPPRPKRRRLVPALLLAVALAAAGLFALRLAMGLAGWSVQPQHPVAGWMPLGYVARSWGVGAPELGAALGIEPGAARGQSLERIARERGIPLTEAIARIEAVIAARPRDD